MLSLHLVHTTLYNGLQIILQLVLFSVIQHVCRQREYETFVLTHAESLLLIYFSKVFNNITQILSI